MAILHVNLMHWSSCWPIYSA